MQLGFYFNADECIGCKACVAACKDVHALPVGYKLRKVITGEAGGWETDPVSGLPQPEDVFSYSVSYSCMHCTRPACMAACPKGAIAKDAETGIVSIDEDVCIGCGACAKACPWDAPVVVPRIDGTRRSRKCDLCRDLLAVGEEPACVAACLMRCLKVVVFEGAATDVDDVVGADTDAAAGFPAGPSGTRRSAAQDAAHPSCAPLLHAFEEDKDSVQTVPDGPAGNPAAAAGGSSWRKSPGGAPWGQDVSGLATEPPALGTWRNDPLVRGDVELGPHYLLVPHRGMVEHPGVEVRVLSMPEEYQNG